MSDPSIPERLFVYGTLRRGGAAEERLEGARLLGPARYRGRLYDLGGYPGVVPSHDPADVVHGELYALPEDAAALLAHLDRYEGPGFRRAQATVLLVGNNPQTCWIYLYVGALDGRRRIPSGNYADARDFA